MLFPATLSEMSPDVGEDGYRRVMLYRDGQTVRELVHRLVLTAFERPAANGEQGLHSDGNPSNNALANLCWGDQSANWDDRRRHGEFRSYAKLTFEQAAEIRRRFQAGETGASLGREFGISDTQARNIGKGHQWAVAAPIQWPLPNCWKGISAEDQRRADERVPDLLATPAAVRFVSAEPMLGVINLDGWLPGESSCGGCEDGAGLAPNRCGRKNLPRDEQCPENWCVHRVIESETRDADGCPDYIWTERVGLDWIIVGGESGPNARPMHPQWARDIRDQCAAAGVPFFFKQWGEWADINQPENGALVMESRERHFWSDGTGQMMRVGKARAGRLLDRIEHNAMPEAR